MRIFGEMFTNNHHMHKNGGVGSIGEPLKGSLEWASEKAEEYGGRPYRRSDGEWGYDMDTEGQD